MHARSDIERAHFKYVKFDIDRERMLGEGVYAHAAALRRMSEIHT
jgi:hypothetical protein